MQRGYSIAEVENPKHCLIIPPHGVIISWRLRQRSHPKFVASSKTRNQGPNQTSSHLKGFTQWIHKEDHWHPKSNKHNNHNVYYHVSWKYPLKRWEPTNSFGSPCDAMKQVLEHLSTRINLPAAAQTRLLHFRWKRIGHLFQHQSLHSQKKNAKRKTEDSRYRQQKLLLSLGVSRCIF